MYRYFSGPTCVNIIVLFFNIFYRYNAVVLTISAHPHGDAFFQSAVLTTISVYSQDAALLVLGAGPVLDLLLYGPSEEALRITAAVRVSLEVRALVAGAAGVSGLPPALQHAH